MHSHCDKCFVPSICKYIPRSSDDSDCCLILCPLNCGVKLHECKIEDHENLCPENVVPCLNAQYGCHSFMKRKTMHKHLRRCRAYTIECGAEWNRFPAYPMARKSLKELAFSPDSFRLTDDCNNLPLDFAFALNDQKKVVQSYCIPSKLRKLYRNVYTPGHPTLPLPLPKLTLERQNTCRSPSSEMNSVSEGDYPSNSTKQIPGLAASVLETLTNKRNSCPVSITCDHSSSEPNEQQIDNSSSDSDDDRSSSSTLNKSTQKSFTPIRCALCQNPSHVTRNNQSEDGPPSIKLQTKQSNETSLSLHKNPLYDEHGLHLNLYPDFHGSCHQKPKMVYSFRCGKVLQCGDYADHYKNLHCDVVDSLDDWLIVRCPLFYKGCDYYSFKWSLNDDKDHFVFDQWQQSFAVSDRQTKCQSSFDLLSLPFNILCLAASFLDPFTLNNLSLVCTTLRAVARSQLKTKGLVEIIWDKIVADDGRCKWEAKTKRWFFSVAYQSVCKRHLKNNEIAAHLNKCKFYTIEVRTEPWPLVGTNVAAKK